jgi:IS30 family transposase
MGRRRHGRGGEEGAGSTAGGRRRGARNRLPSACRWIFPQMIRCVSATRRFIRLFTCKAGCAAARAGRLPSHRPCTAHAASADWRQGKILCFPRYHDQRASRGSADRAVPGHWEGDLILGLGSSAIGTLVERMTRFTILLHLPRMAAYGNLARMKNGPALAGHGAEAVRDAITRTITTLPEQIRQSLTWDQGAEMAQHANLRSETGLQVYFCDPRSPWQRGTNENTNGLLRPYFPKGTDLSAHSADDLAAVAMTLNSRPGKALGWKTPVEALNQYIR